MRRILSETGFRELHWQDVTEHVKARIAQQMAAAAPRASPLGLFLVMPNFAEASHNHRRNLQAGRVPVIEAVLERQ